MKGTDCTPEQIAHASEFMEIARWPVSAPTAKCSRDQTARLLAWYGAMRFQAGRDGVGGTLEKPGFIEVKPREKSK